MFKIIIPGVACVVTAPVTGEEDFLAGAIQEGYQIIYILCNNGDKYLHRVFGKNADGTPCFARFKIMTIPGFRIGELSETNQFLPAGKIPLNLLMEVQKFFKSVIAKFGDVSLEAMIWIMWDSERGYFLHVPDQSVAGASVTYDWANLPMTSEGRPSRIIVDIHSHANFGAFFSGTDDRDDAGSIRYSGVIGFNKRPDPEMKFRFNFQDVKRPVEIMDIFEYPRPQVEETPTDWLEKVKMTQHMGYQGSGSYYGQHGGYQQGQHGTSHYQGGSHHQGNAHFPGGHGSWGPYGSTTATAPTAAQIAKDDQPPKPWTAPKPSNATIIGEKGREPGWFLENGGFISFSAWEKKYPEAVKEQRVQRTADEEAKIISTAQGGQQGTLPLALTGPTSPSSQTGQASLLLEGDSPSQWDHKSGVRVAKSNNEPTEKPKQHGNLNSSESLETKSNSSPPSQLEGLSTPSHSSPQGPLLSEAFLAPPLQRRVAGQTAPINGSTEKTSSSVGPGTGQSSDQPQNGAKTETSTTSSLKSTGAPFSKDPLTVFTEGAKGAANDGAEVYVAGQENGIAVLRPVILSSDAQLDELEATWKQELREQQKALENGQKSAMLEDTTGADGKAPVGVLPVEVPVLKPRSLPPQSSFREQYLRGTPQEYRMDGNSEVDPLGGSFCAPRLQVRPEDNPKVGEAPILIRKPMAVATSTYSAYVGTEVGVESGSFVEDWLLKRSGAVRLAISDANVLPESAIERMHNRAQQEALLESSEDLNELQEGASILFERNDATEDIQVWPDNTITLRLAGDDLPGFNADVIDYGKQSAGVKAVIEVGVKSLQTSGRDNLKRRLVQDLFETLDNDDKLPVFRTLVTSLPPHARESLETNGL